MEVLFFQMEILFFRRQHSLGGLENSIIRLSLNKSDSVQRVNAVLKKP